MSLRRLALGTLLAAFPGRTAPDWALDLVTEGLAGHVLFGFNVENTEQLAALTASLRAARPDVLIGIDEEGGDVTRLGHIDGSPYPGNAALGAIGDPALTGAIYRMIGEDLAAVGVNLNLAPSVDVNTVADNPIIGTRSFGADPAAVAAHSAAAVEGLQAAGVAACAKHFPGHGATGTDSHTELPTVEASLDLLRDRDLPPFVAAIAAGTRSIMTAHIRVPDLTGDMPATFSRSALVTLLRAELGFSGAIITDALEMQGAARVAGGTAQGAVYALAAGADLLCIGAEVTHDLVEEIVTDIVAAVGDGRLSLARLTDAAARTAHLAAWVTAARGDGTATAAPADALPAQRVADDAVLVGTAAARRAITIEGTLPPLAEALVVQLESASTIAEGPVPWGVYPHVTGSGPVSRMRVSAAQASAPELLATAAGRPIVVAGRNLHRRPGATQLIEALAASTPVVVVEMGWPSSWRPAGVAAFVTTYGASRANGRAAAEALGLVA
ncbi:MAG TPA: glycoside hydrolase family 3 N-terminal domain-containing protein [Micromonosporaceae bacterium]|nr:glycoside hydrolase family 3 N-terminal domain-containing protein [Micromonosporaceae bacterium]